MTPSTLDDTRLSTWKARVWVVGVLGALALGAAVVTRHQLRRVLVGGLPVQAATRPATPPAEVTLSVNASKRHDISRFIYGLNARSSGLFGKNATSLTTLDRQGGNRYTAYNFLTNDSNCGNDCGEDFPNDAWLAHGLESPSAPGAVVTRAIDAARQQGTAASMVTVPTLGWVAADHAGATAPLPVAPSREVPASPSARFRRSVPVLTGAEDAGVPRPVVQADFVKLLLARYPGAVRDPVRPLFFTLDNEPDLWGSTHAEIRGKTRKGEDVFTGFDELGDKTVAAARMVKDLAPDARVFAPGLSGWFGFYGLGNKAPPPGSAWYIDAFLERVERAGKAEGRRLVDVLDLHWYPEARNVCQPGEQPCWSDRILNDWQPQTTSVVQARVQSPRSLWDPTFVEQSWVSQNVPGCSRFQGCAVKLLPRVKESIDRFAPGTKLAISEYYFGRGGDISGAIAQADALGIFGREGIYAAALWPSAGVYAWNKPAGACDGDFTCATLAYGCVFAAFRAFLDFDGKGARFGDVGLEATASDAESASVYASVAPENPERLVIIAINKRTTPLKVKLALSAEPAPKTADVFRVTGDVGRCEGPTPAGKLELSASTPLTLPPMSITVLVTR